MIANADDGREIVRQIGPNGPAFHALVVLRDAERVVDDLLQRNAVAGVARRPAERHEFAKDRLDARELCRHEAEAFARVFVQIAAFQHLDQRADRRERVANFMGDSRGEQPERGHLLLV